MRNEINLNGNSQQLRSLFLDTLSFKFDSCGVSHKDLPYIENWTFRSDGYISHIDGASSVIYHRNLPLLRVKSGETIVTQPFLAHKSEIARSESQKECILSWAHFQFFVLDSIDIFTFFDLPRIFSGEQSIMLKKFCTDLNSIKNDAALTPLLAAIKMKKIGFDFLDNLFEFMPLNGSFNYQLWNELQSIEPALKFIQKNYYTPIAIDDLASRCNMSVSGFFAIFRRIMKIAPMGYIINRRIQKAQQLLSVSELSIKEVALQSGYEDQFFFSKIFKKYTGSTPRDYRKSMILKEQKNNNVSG